MPESEETFLFHGRPEDLQLALDDESDEERLPPLEDIPHLISSRLDSIQGDGSFATAAHDIEFVDPGLVIEGFGDVRLPLSPEDAKALILVSHPISHRNQTTTLGDDSATKTWEIDAERVTFGGGRWRVWLDRVLEEISARLGIRDGPGIQAVLHKLFLYEEGASVEPYKHAPGDKIREVFGTLLVSLPSKHLGGAIRLKHGSKESILKPDTSPDGISYFAWYNDVPHEVLPVVAGYRFAISYDLLDLRVGWFLSAAKLDSTQSDLDSILTKWEFMDEKPQSVSYILQQGYPGPINRLLGLTGPDYYRCVRLDRACRSNGRFSVFLANMRRELVRTGPHRELNVEQRPILSDVVTLDSGIKVADHVTLSKDQLACRNPYENRVPFRSWEGEHHQDHDLPDLHLLYRDSVAVIVPWEHMAEFVLGHDYTLEQYRTLLHRLAAGFIRASEYERRLMGEMINNPCQKHLSMRYPSSRDKDAFMGPTLVGSLLLRNPAMTTAALDAVEGIVDAFTFKTLGSMDCEATRVLGAEAFSRMSKLYLVYRSLTAYRSGIPPYAQLLNASGTSGARTKEWEVRALCRALHSVTEAFPEDAEAVARIGIMYQDRRVQQSLATFVRRFEEKVDFQSVSRSETLSRVQAEISSQFDFSPPEMRNWARDNDIVPVSQSSGSSSGVVREDAPLTTLCHQVATHNWGHVSDTLDRIENEAIGGVVGYDAAEVERLMGLLQSEIGDFLGDPSSTVSTDVPGDQPPVRTGESSRKRAIDALDDDNENDDDNDDDDNEKEIEAQQTQGLQPSRPAEAATSPTIASASQSAPDAPDESDNAKGKKRMRFD